MKKQITMNELRKRVAAIGLNPYQATVLLGWKHVTRFYAKDVRVSAPREAALRGLEAMAQLGTLPDELKRREKEITALAGKVRLVSLKHYRTYIATKKVKKTKNNT